MHCTCALGNRIFILIDTWYNIMNYHITNVIYVISSNSLGQMQTRMEFLLLFKDYFIKKLLTKENQMILPSNDMIFYENSFR